MVQKYFNPELFALLYKFNCAMQIRDFFQYSLKMEMLNIGKKIKWGMLKSICWPSGPFFGGIFYIRELEVKDFFWELIMLIYVNLTYLKN